MRITSLVTLVVLYESGVKSVNSVYNNADSVTNNDTAVRLNLEH